MKLLLLFLFVFLHISVFSQSFWSKVVDDQNYNKSIYKDGTLFSDSIILVGSEVGVSCPGTKLFAFDLKGNRLWDIPVTLSLIYADSKYFYTAGMNMGQDDVGGDESFVISKYENQGNQIFETSLWAPSDVDFVPTSMDVRGDGSLFVSFKNSILKADSVGNVKSRIQMKFKNNISGIQFMGNDSLLINAKSMLYQSNLSYNLLDSISFSENNVSTFFRNDTIYSLFPHKLLILNAKLDILDTLITNNEIEFSGIKLFDGDLWVMGKQAEQAKLLHLHNKKVTETLSYDLLLQFRDFMVTPETVIFTGESNSDQIAVSSFNRKVDPEPINLPDIELVDFNIHNVTFNYYPNNFPYGYSFDTEMTLKNNGTDTITSFAVFNNLHGGTNCAQNYFYQKFSNIQILPNQSLTIDLYRMGEYGINYNELCFELLAPNSSLETNLVNNSLCKTFDLTGTDELAELKPYCIFPNPVKDLLKIKFKESGAKKLRITSLDGRQVLETKTSGAEVNLDLSGLNAGIYLLSVRSTNGEWVEKLVKQ